MLRRLLSLLLALGLALPAQAADNEWWLNTGSGGGGGIPGVAGTKGNDLTIDYLMDATRFKALPTYPRFYVSAEANTGCTPSPDGSCLPQGSDTGSGSILDPLRTIEKAMALLSRGGVIVVLDVLDTWDTAAELGTWTNTVITGTCPAGSSATGPMTDIPWGFLTASGDSGMATIDGTNLDLSSDAIPAMLQIGLTGSCYVGIAGIRTTNMPRSPISRGFLESKAIWETSGGTFVIVGSYCDGLVGSEAHCYSQTGGGGRIVTINSGARARAASEFDEGAACLPTGTCCSGEDTPYFGCTIDATSQFESNMHLFEVGSNTAPYGRAGYLVIGGDFDNNVDQLLDGVGQDSTTNQELASFVWEPAGALPYDVTMIGVSSRGPAAISRSNGTLDGAVALGRMPQSQLGTTMNTFIARSIVHEWPAWTTWQIPPHAYATTVDGDAAGSRQNLTWFQNTVRDMYRGLTLTGQFPSDRSDSTIQCSLFDQIRVNGGTAHAVEFCGGNVGLCNVTADATNVYDAVSGTYTVFADVGTGRTTAALVQDESGAGCASDPDVAPCAQLTDAWMGNDAAANELAGTAVDGDAFGTLASQGACAAGQDCAAELCLGVTATSPAMSVFVPSAVGGQIVKTFTVGTHYHRVGAK